MNPILGAVAEIGGSASVEEIRDKVISILGIPEELVNLPYVSKRGGKDSRTSLEYDLAWARTYLKQLGYLQNSSRGVWSLTKQGRDLPPGQAVKIEVPATAENKASNRDWKADLNRILIETLSPAAFERLVQRVLRETGFTQVEVTGRTGDGGIDGKGIAKINGILSFRVVFQCKRYKGAVGAGEVRDFQGAMQGRADKGLLITTGYFTRDALREAARDGAVAIDLVDGDKLAEKLKELNLGVRIEAVETVTIDNNWFSSV